MPKPPGFNLQLTELEPSWVETGLVYTYDAEDDPIRRCIFGEIVGNVIPQSDANRATLDRMAPNKP